MAPHIQRKICKRYAQAHGNTLSNTPVGFQMIYRKKMGEESDTKTMGWGTKAMAAP
jgi:hypothetical protein